ncbi:MAG: hypothetical protein ACR2P1_12125 [Pseudomonadales bacterium]
MPNNNKNDARLKSIRQNVQELLTDLLRSAEVFASSDDVSTEEYRELMRVFIPKLRHLLVLTGQLGDSTPAEPPSA